MKLSKRQQNIISEMIREEAVRAISGRHVKPNLKEEFGTGATMDEMITDVTNKVQPLLNDFAKKVLKGATDNPYAYDDVEDLEADDLQLATMDVINSIGQALEEYADDLIELHNRTSDPEYSGDFKGVTNFGRGE